LGQWSPGKEKKRNKSGKKNEQMCPPVGTVLMKRKERAGQAGGGMAAVKKNLACSERKRGVGNSHEDDWGNSFEIVTCKCEIWVGV